MRIKFIQKIIDKIRKKNNQITNDYPLKYCQPIFVFDGKRDIDKTVLIREGVIVQNPKGTEVVIGTNSQIGPYVVMFGGNIKIGEDVMIGPHTTIVVGQHNWKQTSIPMRFADSIKEEDIIIEDDVWIGANCTIASGAYVSKGVVVGANSFVNSKIPPYAIVAGSPAKIIKYRNKEGNDNV